jgi:hypothetical protein
VHGSRDRFAPAFDLGKFAVANRGEFGLADPGEADNILFAHHMRVRAIHHRPHGEFRLRRHADLAHEDKIERSLHCSGDRRCHLHAAPRQGQHDHTLTAKFAQRGG